MAVRAVSETDIARPPELVAAYASDPRNDTAWIGGLERVDIPGELPLRAGSRVSRVSRFLGRPIVYVLEVEACEAGRRLVMRSVAGPFPMRVTYEFEATPCGTRMRIINEGDTSGFFRIAAPMLSRMVKARVDGDLMRLKAALEKQAPPSS
jgi:hypothetical protein